MRFTKMHGIGNDYVYVDCFREKINNPSALARKISDRHFGVGSDGLILICPSSIADVQMIMYNADGSQSPMCGNGIRCVGKYIHDKGLTSKTTVSVETLAGVKNLNLHLGNNREVLTVTVDMGVPILTPVDIPVQSDKDAFIEQPVSAAGQVWNITAVSMGNPHGVTFVDALDKLNLSVVGPALEKHRLFPQSCNAEFVEIIDRRTLKMRVWERGTGETLACGTGACASLVAAVLTERADRDADLVLSGGTLHICWEQLSNHVFMTGPAEFVFDGEYPV